MKRYHIQLTTETPLLMGGVTPDPVLDSVTAVRERGKPYIPASALKGALRIEFEKLLRTLGETVCRFVRGTDPAYTASEGCGQCLVCRLFGGGGKPGKLRFYDLDGPEEARFLIRTQVSISRRTGRAVEKKLFTRKFVAPDTRFTGEILVLDPLTEEEERDWERFLAYLKKTGLVLGGGKSAGMGRVQFDYRIEESPTASGTLPLTMDQEPWGFFKVELRFSEPLHLGYRRIRYVMPTLRYIPGPTIRGAFAFALLEAGASESEIQSLFVDGKKGELLRFSNFYLHGDALPYWTTLRRPKGKRGDERDILIHDFLLHLAPEEELYRHVFGDPDPLEPLPPDPGEPQVHLFTRLTIHRSTGAAHEERLYTIEALVPEEEGLSFYGYIYGPKSWEFLLRRRSLRVGGRTTKGFGKGWVELVQPTSFDDFEARVRAFNQKIADVAQKHAPLVVGSLQDRVYFTLDLLSEVALSNGETLRGYLEGIFGSIEDFRIERAWLRGEERGGFDALALKKDGRPAFKPRCRFIKRGSVILLSVPQTRWPETAEILKDLLKNGLGARTHEGFGFFTVCDEVHYR